MSNPTAVAARSYLTLCQDLFREVGAAGTAPTTTVGATGEWLRLCNYVRDAELEIQNRNVDWRWLRKVLNFFTVSQNQTAMWSTATGTATGSSVFPPDLGAWVEQNGVWQLLPPNSTQYAPIIVAEWEKVRNQVFDTTDFSQPWRVIIMPDNTIRWDLIPDQAYQGVAEYYTVPYQIGVSGTPDADISNIPIRFANQIIVEMARIRYGFFENASEQVQRGNLAVWGDPAGEASAIQNGASGMMARLENDQLLNRKKSRFQEGNAIVISTGEGEEEWPWDGGG